MEWTGSHHTENVLIKARSLYRSDRFLDSIFVVRGLNVLEKNSTN